MSTNRRYAHHYDELMNQRITEMAIRPRPVTLTEEEIDLEHDPATTDAKPVPVSAWVHYTEHAARVKGEAIAWNSAAVLIRWESVTGEKRESWVWASAVTRL